MASLLRKFFAPIYRDVSPLHITASPTSTSLTNASTRHKLGIAHLPDEIILALFRLLGAEKTTHTLVGPRHAYNFAITNTRYFIIFRTFLTEVTPRLEGNLPQTLSKEHLLSVVRIAGPNLRKLELPYGARPVLYHLPALCPNLQRLSFMDLRNPDMLPVERALTLPLKALHVTRPSGSTLDLITQKPLDELCLTRCCPCQSNRIRAILENPPRKFYLQVHVGDVSPSHPNFEPHFRKIFASLEKAKHRIEDLTFRFRKRMYYCEDRHNLAFLTQARTYVEDPIRSEVSSCRRVVLGRDALNLIRMANPDAEVLLQDVVQSFTYVNGELYPVKLPLWDSNLNKDLSYVRTVIVGREFHPQWINLLANTQLELAVVEDPCSAERLQLHTKEVHVHNCHFQTVNWLSYNGLEEVRIMGAVKISDYFELRQLFDNLTHLLDQFQGYAVGLRTIRLLSINDDLSMQAANRTLDAVNRFERAGGDAGAVRAFLTGIRWVPRPVAKIRSEMQKALVGLYESDIHLLL